MQALAVVAQEQALVASVALKIYLICSAVALVVSADAVLGGMVLARVMTYRSRLQSSLQKRYLAAEKRSS